LEVGDEPGGVLLDFRADAIPPEADEGVSRRTSLRQTRTHKVDAMM
jgi:hypothetical protein